MDTSTTFGDQVRFIGIPGLAELDEIEQFLDDTRADQLEHIPDVDSTIRQQFGVVGHRSYLLVNDDGTVTERSYGTLYRDVEDLIAR